MWWCHFSKVTQQRETNVLFVMFIPVVFLLRELIQIPSSVFLILNCNRLTDANSSEEKKKAFYLTKEPESSPRIRNEQREIQSVKNY